MSVVEGLKIQIHVCGTYVLSVWFTLLIGFGSVWIFSRFIISIHIIKNNFIVAVIWGMDVICREGEAWFIVFWDQIPYFLNLIYKELIGLICQVQIMLRHSQEVPSANPFN